MSAPARIRWRALLPPVVALWVFRLGAAWWSVGPLVVAVEGLGVGHLPDGDAALFADGGWLASEAVRLLRPTLGPGFGRAGLGLALAAWLALLPLGALLGAIAGQRAGGRALRLPELAREGGWRFGPLSVLGGLSVLARLIAALVVLALAVPTRSWLLPKADERWADLASAAWLGVGLALHALIGVVHDLARTALAEDARSPWAAVGAGWRALARARGRLGAAWAVRAGAGAALVLGTLAVTAPIDVSQPGSWRLSLLAALHASALLGLAALRASWLVVCSRHLPAQPEPEAQAAGASAARARA